MNVNIWGPRLWRILHGAVYLNSDAKHVLASTTLFESLLVLLPCAYCRESYPEILKLATRGSLKHVFESGQGNEFVYRLHNLVNLKLQRQKIRDALSISQRIPVGHDIIEKLYPPISFNVVLRRLSCTQGKPFDENDVWFTLFAFILNYSDMRWHKTVEFSNALSILLAGQPPFAHISDRLAQLGRYAVPKTARGAVFVISKCAEYKNPSVIWDVASSAIPV